MAKFVKKPIVIEAVQFKYAEYADNPLLFDEVPDWLSVAINEKKIVPDFKTEDYWYLMIETLEGTMFAGPDDWIICGIKGEIYPCKNDIFKATYTKLEETKTMRLLGKIYADPKDNTKSDPVIYESEDDGKNRLEIIGNAPPPGAILSVPVHVEVIYDETSIQEAMDMIQKIVEQLDKKLSENYTQLKETNG